MKPRKNLILALACFIVVGLLVMGCTPARRPMTDNQNNLNGENLRGAPAGENQNNGGIGFNDRNMINRNGINNGNGVNDNGMFGTNGQNANTGNDQLEDQIKREVERIEGVDNAVVIINNRTAYVGIDADGNISENKMNNLKDQVIERARRTNDNINRVYVSADMDVTDRLRGYGTEIREGRPISGLIEEIEEMFRRPLPRS